MSEANGNSAKWGIVISIATAFIGLQIAVVKPLYDKVDALQKQLDKHEGQPHHYGTAEKLSAQEVKFTEVETQFKWYREISDKNDLDLSRRIEKLENKK